jgi:hypothetical protein
LWCRHLPAVIWQEVRTTMQVGCPHRNAGRMPMQAGCLDQNNRIFFQETGENSADCRAVSPL